MNFAIVPLFTSFFITALLTYFSIPLIKRLKILDDPKKHKHPAIIHNKPIPRGGGIALFLGVFVTSIFFLPINSTFIYLFAASFISLLVGVIDDKFDISPYVRFITNIISALVVLASGISIFFITNPFGGILRINSLTWHFIFNNQPYAIPLLSTIAAVIWIVWIMNMLNWSKGVDGQMPGIVAISAIIIGILSLRFSPLDQTSIFASQLSFIIAGSALGFLLFNFHPAKIFPGYGATSIYLLLAATSIMASAKLATAILVMGVPMVDGIFTIIRRVSTGHSPFWHDKKHLHHLLLSFGFTQRQIALFYWVVSAILGTLSLFLSSNGKAFVILMVIIVIGGALTFLHFMRGNKNDKNSI